MFRTSDYKNYLPNWFKNAYIAAWATVVLFALCRLIYSGLSQNEEFDHASRLILIIPAIILVWDFVIDVQYGFEMKRVFWPFRKIS